MIPGKEGGDKESLFWVDAVKAVCMICVYWAHVEAYAGAHDFSPTRWFSPFYVNLFFFVSGYLFFRKVVDLSGTHKFSLKERVLKLFCVLVWPTVLFSTLLYFPKILFHQGNGSLSHYAYNVLGGVSYWFTSALVVSQLLLLLFTKLRVSRFSVYFLFSVSLFFSGLWLTVYDDSPFFWYYKSGMGGVLFMALGGLYLQYEFQVDRYIASVRYGLVVALYIVLIGFDVEGVGCAKRCLKLGRYLILVSTRSFFIFYQGLFLPHWHLF